MSLSRIPTSDRALALEEAADGVFAVHDVAQRSGDRIVKFRGQFLRSPELVYETVSARFKELGYVPILRQEDGHDVLIAYPAPGAVQGTSTWVHVALFVVTVVSTLWAGTLQSTGAASLPEFLANWTAGIPFSAALLGILGVHEFGHYIVARRYGIDVTLPYFIPFPMNPFTGTLGAVIRIKSPFESKISLFDVGIAGPLAGLVVAIPVVAIGLATAEVAGFAAGSMVQVFNEPLLFQWMARLIVGERPPGTDIVMNPLLMAGWLGFLITAINLVPVSQLDGGHIAYAILGRHYRVFAWSVFALIAAVTLLYSPQFLIMVAFIFLMGIDHPPALNDLTSVGRGRAALGLLTLLLALTLVTPSPFEQVLIEDPVRGPQAEYNVNALAIGAASPLWTASP